MNKWLILIIVTLAITLVASFEQIRQDRKKYEVAMANVKAYDEQLGYQKKKNVAYQLTVDQLKGFNDSVLSELRETQKELGIKDKNLKSLQKVSSLFTRTDTIHLRDTIFKEPSFRLDTMIQDEWYRLNMGLKYPSTIAVSPEFKSDKHIITSLRKETVNPPKKWWILRLFQKKHYVLNIEVVEKNPYVTSENSKYIEIIK